MARPYRIPLNLVGMIIFFSLPVLLCMGSFFLFSWGSILAGVAVTLIHPVGGRGDANRDAHLLAQVRTMPSILYHPIASCSILSGVAVMLILTLVYWLKCAPRLASYSIL
eukprot:204555-Pyramimonas_sp.AAC.1